MARPLPRGKKPRRRQPPPTPRPEPVDLLTEDRPAPPAPPVGRWGRDLLGDGFEARTYPQPDDDEGAVVMTMVRYRPGDEPMPRRPRFAVLYVHGWADYFIQTELARFWHERGAAFYAVDLRKSGRSIRPHQTPCFVESLTEYDGDLALAVESIRKAHGARVPVVVVAHSQGGLTSALWAARHPEALAGLVLNSPFLEIHGSSLARSMSHPLISQVARRQSRWPLPIPAPGFYDRTINDELGGEWSIESAWRPVPTHPIRPGWLAAVMAGHKQVAAGLDLAIPVLVLTSHRTVIGSRWREEMRTADVILDVKQLWRRIPDLGRTVTLAKVHDALHDVFLSPSPVREHAYLEVDHWFRGFIAPDLRPDRPSPPTTSTLRNVIGSEHPSAPTL